MAFSPEEMAAAQRLIEGGMSGGNLAPGMDKAAVAQTQTAPIPMSRMLGEPEEVAVGNLRLLARPLSQGDTRRQFWPLITQLPFFEAALQTDGPGVDFEQMAQQAGERGIEIGPALLARQWSMLQQDGQVSWLLCEVVALMLVDDGVGPAWPRPDPGVEPGEDAEPEVKSAWLAVLDAPAPEGRQWLDDALDELTIGEWCDLLRALIEVNAGFKRTAQSFEKAANGG